MMRRPLNLKAALAAATLCLLAPAWSGQTRGTPERIEPARTAAAQANPVPPTLPPPETAGALKFDVRRSAEGRELTLPFSQIGQVHHPHEVRRGQFRQRLHFELRTDELVRRATLTLMLAPSPDLLGRNDLLVVKLNSETVGRIAVPPASGLDRSGQFSTRLELDPKLLTDSNELTVQFAAPPQCDSAQFPRVSVNGHSSLQLTVQPLPLANDLSVLPSPFFDRRDPGQTEVTLVTSDRPDGSTLQAAGQLASWFGALAGHRGARIRSRADLPAGHAIVLATAQDRPAGVSLPPITGATVVLGSHPSRPGAKVLYLLGRDGAELRRAVEALVRAQLPAQGSSAVIDTLPEVAPRQPHDALRWTSTQRPVRFDELLRQDQLDQLGFSGTLPDAMGNSMTTSLQMRLPPDLFAWRERVVPVDLRLTHSPRPFSDPRPEQASIELRLNNEQALIDENLAASQPRRWIEQLWQQISGDKEVKREHRHQIRMPVESLGTRSYNAINIRIDHGPFDERAQCLREAQAENSQGGRPDETWSLPSTVIDGSSTIDFSDVPHYLPMPDLAAFANAGFPFTRMADLSETAIVLPDLPMREEIDAMLGVASRLGEGSGVAGRLLEVVRVREIDRVAQRELVVIGSAGSQPLFTEWVRAMPFRDLPVAGSGDLPETLEVPFWQRWLQGLWQRPKFPPLPQQTFRSVEAPAVIAGFESPLRAGRSVVALIGATAADLELLTDALADAERLRRIHGHLSSVRDETPEGVRPWYADPTYGSGELPWLTRLRWELSNKPVLLWLVLFGAILALSLITFVLLQRHAIRRRAGSPL